MADKHQPDSSNSVQMGIRHKQGMPMQSQFEQAILDVYDFCIKEKEAGVPIIPLNHFSKRVCELLKISDSSVKRVLRKRENGEPLAPVKRTRNRKSPVTNIDDFTRDAIARKVHAYNFQDKHFTMAALLEECKTDLGFKGCEGSLRAILQKQLGFVFKKVDNKLKLEQKKVIKKRTRSPKQQKSPKKTKKMKQNSVPVQTQTMQTAPVPDMSMGHPDRSNNIDHMGATMHTIPINRGGHTGMEDIQMRHQAHQTDTIEHMALTGLVAHRANVIENMAMAHRANEMAMQQHHRGHPIEGMTTVINEYRKQ